MNNLSNTTQKEQSVHLINRKTLSMSGVTDVISFDETFVVLSCQDTVMSIEGQGMRVVRMDVGSSEMVIEGKITAICYTDKRVKRNGLFGKK